MSNHRRFRRNDKSRGHEEMIPILFIPILRDKVGLLVGRKGRRLQKAPNIFKAKIFLPQPTRLFILVGYYLNMSNLQRPKVIKVIPIPKDKVGLVIGRKGSRLQEIRDKTGVQVSIKDNHAHLRGTAEQCQNAEKMIEDILKVRTDVHNQDCPSLSLRQSTMKPVGDWLAYI